ncbi:MAG: hypothetical protein MNPFHGCM_00537 [Gemmatimonadaceae bacterium]|nr:hypothetical protein [Gemmatimonadaceae bacterium]
MVHRHLLLVAAISAALPLAGAHAQRPATPPVASNPPRTRIADASNALSPDSAIWQGLEWRNVGPANTSGRAADVEGVPGNPNVVLLGSASGGVWKTTNGGVTWRPIFDGQQVLSTGDIALEPGNPEVIYVGTGEGAPRNSISFGNGVYKSTDGGSSWRHIGLATSERITRLLISPRNPQVVYAGVLGHVFGPNPDRGVYMSANGGESWEKVLYIDDVHGVADMDIDPRNPNVIYAAMWRFQRKPWTHTSGSDRGGVFRSVDAGRTWKKLTNGLPTLMGRIAVKVSPSNPDVVYVLAESNEGTLFRSSDKGESFTTVNRDVNIVNRGFYFTQLRVDPTDENRVWAISGSLFTSIDAGKTFRLVSSSTHSDYHALWIDPQNPNRMWQAQDGGSAVSYDRGETWESMHHIAPLTQLYAIYADRRAPFYNVGGGLQDNGTWTGPSRSREPAGIMNDDWRMISFGDGFQLQVHPDDPDVFLSESQGGGLLLTNMRTREQVDVSPQPRRNDGGPVKDLQYRFNWNSPIIQSPHDGKVIYFAGNVIFRSANFGLGAWERISPDLTKNEPDKQVAPGGPVWKENTTAEYYPTIISFAESPAQRGVLWAGTDDGNLQLSRDDGKTWSDLTAGGPPMPTHSPVSHVEPSRVAAATAYVAYDRHMFDDFGAHIFKTVDFGRTWTDVTDNLPAGAYVHVVREDPKVPDLIYAGTEIGLFVSRTGGGKWARAHLKNLPAVAVHDILVHPVMNDLIVATHGRGIWILDDATPLQRFDGRVKDSGAELFDIRSGYRYSTKDTRFMIGNKVWLGANPPYGALITYYLGAKPDSATRLKLEIVDATGKTIREILKAPASAGMNRINWDLTYDPPRARRESAGPGGFFFGPPRGPQAVPGIYTARLTIGNEKLERPVEVRMDPAVEVSMADLRAQFDAAMNLREMRSAMNDTLRAIDAYRAQLVGRKNVVATLRSDSKADQIRLIDAEIADVDSLLTSVTQPQGKPFWSEGPRITERLGALANSLDDVNRAPTPHQIKLLGELQVEWKEALAKVAAKLGKVISLGPDVQGTPLFEGQGERALAVPETSGRTSR